MAKFCFSRRIAVLGMTVWIGVAFAGLSQAQFLKPRRDGPGPRVSGRHRVDQLRPTHHVQAPRQGRIGPLLDQRML